MHVLIADAAPSVRAALKVYVQHCRIDTEITEVASLDELEANVTGVKIDVALIDWHLPRRGGVEALRLLRQTQPEARIIILSGRPESRREVPSAQVEGFVSKGNPPEELHTLLQHTVKCNEVVSTEVGGICRRGRRVDYSRHSSRSQRQSCLLSGVSQA